MGAVGARGLLLARSSRSASRARQRAFPAVSAHKHISMQPNGGLSEMRAPFGVTCQTQERVPVAAAAPWGRGGTSLFCFDVRSQIRNSQTASKLLIA